MAKKTLWQRIRNFFSGNRSDAQKARTNRAIRQKNTGGTRTSASHTNRVAVYRSLRGQSNGGNSGNKEEKQSPYKSMADAIRESSKKQTPDPKEAIRKKAQSDARERLEKRKETRKSAYEETQDIIKKHLDDAKEKRKAYHEATGHRYDVSEKGISKEERQKRLTNIQATPVGLMRFGNDDEALDVAKVRMKYDKVGASAERGIANAVTANAVDLLAKNSKGGRKEAEEYYQKNKSKAAETVGGLAGGLVLYGGTAGAFEGLGTRAVGKAATTKVGKKLGAEALKRTMAGTGAKAAITRSLVGDAIQDSTIGLADTIMGVAARDDLKTKGDYAKAIAEGQAINYGMGLLGNAAAHGLPVAGRAVGRAWGNFADKSRRLRFVPNGVGEGLTADGRRLVMNGGVTRANRLQGVQYESGFKPKKLSKSSSAAEVGSAESPRKPSEVLHGYSSAGSKKKLSDAQKRIREMIVSGDEDGARAELERIVDDVVRNTKTVEPLDDTIREIKEVLRDTKISISDRGKTDAGYLSGGYNEFRKENFGGLKLTKDGQAVDDLWISLQEKYGTSLFPDDIENPSDQLQYLADLSKTKGDEYDLMDDEADWLREELSNSLWASANAEAKAMPPKTEAKAAPPKARSRKPSKSEARLEEVRAEMKALDDEIERMKASGEDTIEKIREWNNLHSEARKLRKNIDRAEKAREKRATDKAMKRWEESNAKADAEKSPNVIDESESRMPTTKEVEQADEAAGGASAKGERTEFRRSEEPSAKEQARNKRSEKRTKATQEDFDRDFADFEKKVNENREKVSQLNGRLRAAATAEEKQAIKDEIKALDDEIKRLYNKASLKYHPDRGGTTEWAQKFNGAYDGYKKRVYSSPNFEGASSKSSSSSTRGNAYKEYRQRTAGASAGAGNGGNTPPPPKGGKYADYDGLRRPKGYARRKQRAMHSVEDMVGATKTKRTMRDALRSFRDEANRKFVDSMKDFEQMARERLKTHGKEAMQKMYGAIDKARRYRAIATTSVGSHQLKWDGTRYQVKGKDGVMRDAPSIAEIFSGLDKETEKSFNAYLLLNHNIDRLREGKPVFDNTLIYNEELSKRLGLGKDIDLMDADVCKKLVQDYEARFPDFQERAAQIRQYTANELNNRVQAGLLSKETMDEWLHKYPNYVPTYREGLFDGISASKGATVGASDLKAAKGSDLNIYDIKEQLADATVRNWRDISLNNLLEESFGANIKELASSAEVSPYMFALDHTMNVGKAADGGKYYANIYRNGKPERVEIDKRFYDDIKDLYKNGRMGNGLDALNDKALVPLAGLWKNLITEWSPIFMVKNFMRDYPEAIINSRNRKEFLEISANFSALKDLLHGGKFSSSLRDMGISASTFIDIDKAVKDWEKGKGSPLKLLAKLNAGVEMYPRLIEYMATIKKADFDLDSVKIEDIPQSIRDMAAANAADVTVNFGRSGSVGKMINKGFVPFFNPSVQGWSKFARNVTENAGAGVKETLSFVLSATALGAAPMVITNLLYHNNPNYQRISARDKANNYIIAVSLDPNEDTFIKIPRSRFASVYGLPLVNVANENKASFATAFKIVNDQVAPINPLESHFGANLVQAARNKTWYGTPIESEAMQSLPANERYDATTSSISVGAAQLLNKATGGKVKVSPKKLDYVLDANFGVIADVGLPIATKANKGDSLPARIGKVGKKAFVIDSTTQNDLSSRYYDRGTLLEQNKNSSEASEDDKTAYKKFNSWNNRVKSVTSAMRYVQGSDFPNKQEAYRELAKLRNENMQKALDGRVSVNNTRDVSIIHKYAGTSYTIENLGKTADKDALKAYSAAVYGNLTDDAMKKRIDSDTEFYKGYEGIVKTQNALQKVDAKLKGGNALTYAVGLADAGANDDVFAAYNTTVKSRTETASKAQRAKDYFENNGSIEEFAQLENAVKSLGKLSDVDKGNLEDEAYAKLKRGEMSIDEYNTELKKIDYNANQSHVGKAVSLAMSGAPARAYNLYDIKERNVQKGYNLAAMGIDSRKYREMSQACDADGNGYLKTAEIRDYVAKSDYEDKATLFDALCYYSNVRNPFGSPTNYSSAQAAEVGKRNGVSQIKVNAGADNTKFVEGKSSGNGYGGYYRRGYGYRHRGGGGKSKVPTINAKSMAAATKSVKGTSVKLTPPTPKTKVAAPKFKKYEV